MSFSGCWKRPTVSEMALLTRNYLNHSLLVVAEPHFFINAAGAIIILPHMEEWNFVVLHLEANEFLDKVARQTATLKVGVSTNAANFAQRTGNHAFSRHGDQLFTRKHTIVLAEFDRSFGKRSRLRDGDKFQDLRYVIRSQPVGNKFAIGGGRGSVPDHLVHGRFGLDPPAIRNLTRQPATIKLFAGQTHLDQGGKVGAIEVRESDNG